MGVTAVATGGKDWTKVLEKFKDIDKVLQVGVLEGSTDEDGESIAAYAAVQEYGGTMTIPARRQHLKFQRGKAGGEVFAKASRKRGVTKEMDVVIPEHQVTIPPRPFLRMSVQEHSKSWLAQFERLAKAALKTGLTLEDVFDELGQAAEKDVQALLEDGASLPALAPSTVASKKAAGYPHAETPVVRTGRLMRAISHEVVAK